MANKYVSVVTGGSHSATTTAAEINAFATDFVSSGVVGTVSNTSGVAPATGAFAVNAQGTPNMTVAVTGGVGYVTATPSGGSSQQIRVYMDALENITINSNSTGSTRYDWLYLKVDPVILANPAVTKNDVFTLAQSRSTSNSVDNGTPPTYGIVIGVVTVVNSAATISNANIADSRVVATAFASSGWSSWSPAWTNLTVGNGTIVAKYIQLGKTVFWHMALTLGSTSGVGTAPSFTFPIPKANVGATTGNVTVGHAWMEDAGIGNYQGVVLTNDSTNQIYISVGAVGGTYQSTAAVTATVPFTWGTNDALNMQGFYEAA